jgi:endonuclease/exonuclease/phosphatase family metal-dependent hydrolase
VQQSGAILDLLEVETGPTLLTGDLNALPDSPEMVMLRDAGLSDTLDLLGISPGYTFRADNPVRRIDYIWLSPSLTALDADIPRSTASDHLPIVATIDLK